MAGYTHSPNFPGVDGKSVDSVYQGYNEAFVARLDADLETLEAATYLGGSSCESAEDVMRSALGPVFVVGFTRSPDFPGPGPGAADPNFQGASEAWVARLNADLTTLTTTFIGGGVGEGGFTFEGASAIDEDSAGNLYAAGTTFEGENFPGIGPSSFDPYSYEGGGDAFVVKLNQTLTTILAATFLGGSFWDGAEDLQVAGAGSVLVTGWSGSDYFPGPNNGYPPWPSGWIRCGDTPPKYAVFAAVFTSDLSSLLASECYFGGMGNALVPAWSGMYVTGVTNNPDFAKISAPPFFPPAPADYTQTLDEGFVLRLDLGLPPDLSIAINALKKQLMVSLSAELTALLDHAEALGARNQDKTALQVMDRFVRYTEKSVGRGELTADQGAELLRQAEEIIKGLRAEAANVPLPYDDTHAREQPPLPERWDAIKPPYAWRVPMLNRPGDYPPTPKEVDLVRDDGVDAEP